MAHENTSQEHQMVTHSTGASTVVKVKIIFSSQGIKNCNNFTL